MPNRSRKEKPAETSTTPADQPPPEKQKDPAAVALGRRGGLKGGPARAAKLTKEQLSASAKKAAQSRWNRRDGGLDADKGTGK